MHPRKDAKDAQNSNSKISVLTFEIKFTALIFISILYADALYCIVIDYLLLDLDGRIDIFLAINCC